MQLDPTDLPPAALAFLTERHLATLASVRPDGSPHLVPVGFSWQPEARLARVITSAGSVKARLARAGGPVSLCQLDGARWLTLQGTAAVSQDAQRVADAVTRYAERYRQPRPNPARVVIEITVHSVLGSPRLLAE
ncbi:MAG TPA: PPOX class F420-dependent oxidoreductase [Jatrophihabitans sp.]|nr:PPOX class F420-dependent oxidoreductase [Jatrophihabitans sp.]